MASPFKVGNAGDIYRDGKFFRDVEGRYVIFRGVNFAGRSKMPPYLPVMDPKVTDLDPDKFHQELNRVRPYFDEMEGSGFNIVRLLVCWKAIEPDPNPTPEVLSPKGLFYLSLVKEIVDELYRRGIFVFIDFHQDVAHEVCSGDGFPDWALAIDAKHKRPNPPSDLKDDKWGLNYVNGLGFLHLGKDYSGLVRNTLRSFWKNDLHNDELSLDNMSIARRVRSHLEKTVGATARYFRALNGGTGHPGILGYEPFNEPHQAGIDKTRFEEECLSEFYSNVLFEIRRACPINGTPGDPNAFLFIEPRMDWTAYGFKCSAWFPFPVQEHDDHCWLNFTEKPKTRLDPPFGNERVVFSFHYYDPGSLVWGILNMGEKEAQWRGTFDCMLNAAPARKLIPFLTEFGCSQDWTFKTSLRPDVYETQIRAYLDLHFKQIEEHLLNATCWNYDFYPANWNMENLSIFRDGQLLPDIADIVMRPFPMRSSAEPQVLLFDIEKKHCAIVLHGQVVDAATVIYVPRHHYPDGFDILATSGDFYWESQRQLLQWRPDATKTENLVIICPPHAFDKKAMKDNKRVQKLIPLARHRKTISPFVQ